VAAGVPAAAACAARRGVASPAAPSATSLTAAATNVSVATKPSAAAAAAAAPSASVTTPASRSPPASPSPPTPPSLPEAPLTSTPAGSTGSPVTPPGTPPTPTNFVQRWAARHLAAAAVAGDASAEAPRHPLLSLLGWYSTESLVVRNAAALIAGIRGRAASAPLRDRLGLPAALDGAADFQARYALAALHMYLSVRRLRAAGGGGGGGTQGGGAPTAGDAAGVMQAAFDTFWNVVKQEMLVGEAGVGVIQAGRWAREAEQGFFGAAVGYDAALDAEAAGGGAPGAGPDGGLEGALTRNVPALVQLAGGASGLADYVRAEDRRLRAMSDEAVVRGKMWE